MASNSLRSQIHKKTRFAKVLWTFGNRFLFSHITWHFSVRHLPHSHLECAKKNTEIIKIEMSANVCYDRVILAQTNRIFAETYATHLFVSVHLAFGTNEFYSLGVRNRTENVKWHGEKLEAKEFRSFFFPYSFPFTLFDRSSNKTYAKN